VLILFNESKTKSFVEIFNGVFVVSRQGGHYYDLEMKTGRS
jgi:hypothetical protein